MKQDNRIITNYPGNQQEVKVDVLLSTFNGEEYIDSLLRSVISQTHQNWKLIIRDDGSTDSTTDILQAYSKQFPDKIVYVLDGLAHLGPCQSFSKHLKHSSADYTMFCDQDDIWLRDKIEVTLGEMLRLEREFPNKPLLVHTDLTIVDKNTNLISHSFWRYQNLDPFRKGIEEILIQNIVTGCTMMINKQLWQLVYPIPKPAIMHDWWIALVASIYDGIYHVPQATILYRQHDGNSIGAKKYSPLYFLSNLGTARDSVARTFHQATHFRIRYATRLSEKQLQYLDNFISLFYKNRVKRLIGSVAYHKYKHGLLRTIGFALIMFWSDFVRDEVLRR